MTTIEATPLLDTIAGTVASTLKIPIERLDVDADFDSFGMDSIIAIELMNNLSRQLNISITPAQLTSVNSIRELAGVIGSSAAPAPSSASPPLARPATPAAAPRTAARVPARSQARAPRSRPAADAGMERMLDAVRERYGLDLRGHRFASQDALIDHLLAHHAELLADYYGLDTEAGSPHVAPAHEALARPVAALEAGAATPGIAVIGMACRFAEAPTPATLWQALTEGRSAIRPLDGDRWGGAQNPDALSMPRWGARIDGVDLFDAEFFGLTEDEARMCDPQERLVMQSLYHALQHAGLRADKLRGSRTGLFLGYEYAEYEQHMRRNLHRIASAPALSSSSPIYYLANRISFLYDFKGPSEVVNASCASSALAIHRACLALAQDECDLAICGGVSLNLFADDFAAIGRYGLLSPDGRCAVFDDEANGFTRGEGIGLLVLKRLEDAEDGNHRIFAKVVATQQNNRGRAAFISEIKHEAITQVMTDCYRRHGIEPETVRYIEVDGYATKWGDSFEFEGIRNAFASTAGKGKFCALGSIKGNIGHVEPASGVASAIKVALSLHHKRFPATITMKAVNSFIDIGSAAHPLYIADRPLAFDEIRRDGEPIRAGVNSFSDSGVNVHVVFEEYIEAGGTLPATHGAQHLFVFSARARESLLDQLSCHVDFLRASGNALSLEDLAYSMQMTVEPMAYRLAIIAATHKELIDALSRGLKIAAEDRPVESNGPVFIGSGKGRHSNRAFDVIASQIGEDRLLDNLRERRLKDVATLWTSGIDMPWLRHWHETVQKRRRDGEAGPQLIDLPAYAFAERRYWLDFDADAPAAAHADIQAARAQRKANVVAPEDNVRVAETPPSWRFVDTLAEGEAAEPLDAEDKIVLFLAQETAQLLRMPGEALDICVNFLQLGYDSVGMAALIQRLIALLGENISPSIVFTHPDIASLGRHLADRYRDKIDRIHVLSAGGDAAGAAAAARSRAQAGTARDELETWFVSRDLASGGLLVPMQTNASGTPVFAVPGADGSVLSLQTLSRAMEGVRPMFGFQAVGLDGERKPLTTIRAMAQANVEALAGLRDTRKLSLLGHSNGAVVAFEMARQLQKKNVTVERLVLVDCRCPASAARNVEDEISEAFVNLIHALGGDHQLDAGEFRKVPEAERAEYLHALVCRNGFETPKEAFMLAYRISLLNETACRNYRPQKLSKPCATVIVRATRGNADQPPDLGWNKFLAEPAVCVDVDADHLSVVGADGGAAIAGAFA